MSAVYKGEHEVAVIMSNEEYKKLCDEAQLCVDLGKDHDYSGAQPLADLVLDTLKADQS